MITHLLASEADISSFVQLEVFWWHWVVLLGLIFSMLIFDLLVLHREPKVLAPRRALAESVVWISCGLGFTALIWVWFGSDASGEYLSGYLIEESLSIDNVFVWALILGHFKVPALYQHRVLFWGIFGALLMRAVFIFAGVAIIERFEWVLYIFGAFLLYTAAKLVFSDNDHVDPGESRLLKAINKVVPTTNELDGQKLFTSRSGKRLATPLFSVLLLVEATDLVFAVDSVPAILAVSRDQFIVFSSNAFAIVGLRALYFLLADMRNRFVFLQQGIAIILAFVGVKMLLSGWFHIGTPTSLLVIALVVAASVGFSLKVDRSRRDDAIVNQAFSDNASESLSEIDAPSAQ